MKKDTKIAELQEKVIKQQIHIEKQEELKEERKQVADQLAVNPFASIYQVSHFSNIFLGLQQSGRSQYE